MGNPSNMRSWSSTRLHQRKLSFGVRAPTAGLYARVRIYAEKNLEYQLGYTLALPVKMNCMIRLLTSNNPNTLGTANNASLVALAGSVKAVAISCSDFPYSFRPCRSICSSPLVFPDVAIPSAVKPVRSASSRMYIVEIMLARLLVPEKADGGVLGTYMSKKEPILFSQYAELASVSGRSIVNFGEAGVAFCLLVR